KEELPPDYKGAHQTQLEEAEAAGIEPISNPLKVETGLDVLVRNHFDILLGKRVGVITNHTGLTKDGQHIVDLLKQAEGVELVAIFGPEHGVRGVAPDGVAVNSQVDSATGVPVYSLYGKTRRPKEDMIDSVDALVFDIQDVGARFYTYIYTMALAMEAAALHGKKFVVLDRPNPITGTKVEGPMLQDGFQSFVGLFKMPVRHGMTVGELAKLFQGQGWFDGAESLDLSVVKMTGWERRAWYDQTDLPWVGPSPSMKTLATATVYPGTCFIEGTNVSEGRGTDKPFEKIGAPWINPKQLANKLNKYGLKGVAFEPTEFTPVATLPSVPNPKYKDELCGGIYVRVVRRETFKPVKTGVTIIWTIKNLYPDKFKWRNTIDRLYGSNRLRLRIEASKPLAEIVSNDGVEVQNFLTLRAKYLLYD
ncbi:MAG: exo-beta-N-acetylmuramidase NamZ domain-containing protein, partial [bacterium]